MPAEPLRLRDDCLAEPSLPDRAQANVVVPQLLLTPREAAKALAVSERTLWQLTKDGTIPAVHVGRSVRYSLEGLRAWIAAHNGTGACEK
jgi:excisionase family DNA binding protein